MKRYVASTSVSVTDEQAFAYHERQGALQRLIPPWKNVAVESSDGTLRPPSNVVLKLKVGPLSLRWVAEHTEYEPPKVFVDVQKSGPFAKWRHEHRFHSSGTQGCVLRDEVSYTLPLGPVGQLFGGMLARKELETMFAYRHRVTRDDLALMNKFGAKPMKVAVSGSSGLVGRKLCAFLRLAGHQVIRLERSIEKAQTEKAQTENTLAVDDAVAPWHSDDEASKLSGVDAVIHLAGKSIAEGRWTEKAKQAMRESRVNLTTDLATILSRLPNPPKVFLCASAIGIYGDRGDELLTESSAIGDTFLASVGQEWEEACQPAVDAGIRVANARLGIVLDAGGGALKKMLTPAKFCGGALGSGRQWWSWVAMDDVIGAIYHAVCNDQVRGPFNVVAPNPLTNRDFSKALGRVISRPAIVPAPSFLLRLALGEMADALLLASTRVAPTVLEQTGYTFRFSGADDALRYCLGVNRMESIE